MIDKRDLLVKVEIGLVIVINMQNGKFVNFGMEISGIEFHIKSK